MGITWGGRYERLHYICIMLINKNISKEVREIISKGKDSAPKYWRFDDLTEVHYELVRLEKEFLDSVEHYQKGKYVEMYESAHIVEQMRMMADMSKRGISVSDLPFGVWSVIKRLNSGFKVNGEYTMSEQWGANICPECGGIFSTDKEGMNAQAVYCSTKCKRAAEYKRRKAKKKMNPHTHSAKVVKRSIRELDKVFTLYPHHTAPDMILALLKKELQNIEHEQY